ncbi:hypothetical protein EK21DRAFT_69463 [Setomelanomma holmii]|uniref:Uncharacterized protein n=1 Tax=Setomelanomma holmii TaxID=210430 RepID=A0A9P4LKT9_9PLEO|nr:hypothetical protein EK21DRAFT_69463 [Setomelanomma holmii]
MVSFRDLAADQQPLQSFRSRFANPKVDTQGTSDYALPSIAELATQNESTIRVLFAPPDVPHECNIDGMCELFKKFRIPSAFIAEGLQGVSQSFSVQKGAEATYVWFHFLCKDVALSDGRIVPHPVSRDGQDSTPGDIMPAPNESQANFSWLKPGFVLRVLNGPQTSSPSLPSRTTTSSSSSTLIATSVQLELELFCFGAPTSTRDRFQKLIDMASCEDILDDPYILLEIVLHEMYKVLDRTGWIVADIFGEIEKHTLDMAGTPGKTTKPKQRLDFAGLHNLAKHTTYLRENCESGLATLEGLRDHHKSVTADPPSPAQAYTKRSLKYQKTLFQSTQRRLASLDTRIANIIQLSFHIVTQGDSRLMQSENQSMKTIAVTTLVFMPLGTIAGIFGTQFMKLDDSSAHHITVSQDFWLLWLIAAPLTLVVIIVWRVWYADAKRRFTDDISSETERYLGWKTLRRTLKEWKDGRKEQQGLVTRDVSSDAKV